MTAISFWLCADVIAVELMTRAVAPASARTSSAVITDTVVFLTRFISGLLGLPQPTCNHPHSADTFFLSSAPPTQRVDPHRQDDDGADDDLLGESVDGEKVEPIDHKGDDEDAEHRTQHPALAAEHAGAADNHRPDRLQKDIASAKQRLAGDHAATHEKAGDVRASAAD